MSILVTGGMGFIGSNFIRRYLMEESDKVVNFDGLTYAANPDTLQDLQESSRYEFVYGYIGSRRQIEQILEKHKPHTIINFAAESHVDNSILNSEPFFTTNVFGTMNLLECVKRVCPKTFFLHVSTDEVYGSLDAWDSPSTEKTAYAPRSPYAASKAASDHLVMAYHHTHGLRTIITNCSNNYGPYQHAEKFIPTVIRKAMAGEQIPVYGTGMNIRDWIHVQDHCDALIEIIRNGIIGERYNIGGGVQKTNLEVAEVILSFMGLPNDFITFVPDRKGHDFRYDLDIGKIEREIGWRPTINFWSGLKDTVKWYRNNMEWVNSCRKHSG